MCRWLGLLGLIAGLWSGSLALAQPSSWRQLTHDRLFKQDLTFSPDGKRLVYAMRVSPTQLALMELELGTGRVRRLHPQATTSEFEPRFSPDGRYLAYVRSRGNLNLELVIEDLEQEREVTFDPGGGFAGVHAPVFLPGGQGVLFALPEKGGQNLVRIDLQAQRRQDVITGGVNNWPDVSPQGQLVFASTREGNFELYLSDLQGSRLRRLTRHAQRDVRPRWSPDGRWVAFASQREGNLDVFALEVSSGQLLNLTQSPAREDYPCWHPRGTHVAFVSQQSGGSEVYLIAWPRPKPGSPTQRSVRP